MRQTNQHKIEKFLNYLKVTHPLNNHSIGAYFYNSKFLSETLVPNAKKWEVSGMARTIDSHTDIHVAIRRPSNLSISTLAHEYRHAMQHANKLDFENSSDREWDAIWFSAHEVKKYLEALNEPK